MACEEKARLIKEYVAAAQSLSTAARKLKGKKGEEFAKALKGMRGGSDRVRNRMGSPFKAQDRTQLLAALLRLALHRGLRLPLARYIASRHRRRVQERPHHGLELILGDFDGFGHGTIVRPKGGPTLGELSTQIGFCRLG